MPEFNVVVKTNLSLLLLLSLIWASPPALAEKSQKQLQREIRQVSSDLRSQENKYDQLRSEVTQLEKKLGEISRKHYQTEQDIEATQAKLKEANEKKLKLDAELEVQKNGLAQQLQALYTAGEQSHLRLLLKQDEPSDISRTIRYFEYLNENRLERIQLVNKTLAEINEVRISIEKDRVRMQHLTEQLEREKSEISSTINTREAKLDQLKGDIRSSKKLLGRLKSEEAELQKVIDRLEARKAAEAAKASAKTEKPSSSSSKSTQTAKHPPPKTTKGIPIRTSFTPDKPFSTLRGKLSWPTKGKITHSYGSPRNEKQKWRGVVIAADGGTPVKAVAKGRVVFSGWMNGYGHLIIIEHDRNYMSLYGYNRAVYKKEGAIVSANETIAKVGNSGGQSQNALYFEIRKGRTPQNPARWCR